MSSLTRAASLIARRVAGDMEIPHTTMCETPLRAGVEVFWDGEQGGGGFSP